MKHLLSKRDQEKVEYLDQHPEGDWTVYLNKGWERQQGDDGGAFSEDTLADVKRELRETVSKVG